jgi:hypothetical protein
MRDLFTEPGIVSVRSQIGIEVEDERIFRPYTVDEALRVAAILRRDPEIPMGVRALLAVGIVYDLLPGHLSPDDEALARRLRTKVDRIEDRRVRWESVDPVLRFDLVHRATALIIAWRGKEVYGV